MKWLLVWVLAGNPAPVVPWVGHSEAACKAAGAALHHARVSARGSWLCARVLPDAEIQAVFQWQPPLERVKLTPPR